MVLSILIALVPSIVPLSETNQRTLPIAYRCNVKTRSPVRTPRPKLAKNRVEEVSPVRVDAIEKVLVLESYSPITPRSVSLRITFFEVVTRPVREGLKESSYRRNIARRRAKVPTAITIEVDFQN